MSFEFLASYNVALSYSKADAVFAYRIHSKI